MVQSAAVAAKRLHDRNMMNPHAGKESESQTSYIRCERRRLIPKAWSAVLALAGVTLLYVAVVFHLIAFNGHF